MIDSEGKNTGGANTHLVNSLWKFKGSLSNSLTLFRLVGYGLLILAFFDLVDIFVPPRLMNPAWEFQTIGQLVERAAVPLIGLVLVFFGEKSERQEWEFPVLRILSLACVVVGVLFFLLIPLAGVNTLRLYLNTTRNVQEQILTEKQTMDQFQENLQRVGSNSQMDSIVARLRQQGMPPSIGNASTLDGKKEGVLTFLKEQQKAKENQLKSALQSQQLGLLKNAIKWILGALVSGVLFITFWRNTSWTRKI